MEGLIAHPLSNARHVSVMVDGAPSRSTCECLSQLEVHQLYVGGEVVYPEGLFGGLEPLWVPLPKLPIWDTESTCKPTQLQVTLPRTTWGDIPKAIPQWSSTPISSLHSVTGCPSDIATGPGMVEEIEELLSSTMLKMPGQPSTHTSPRRPPTVAPNNPAANGEGIPSDLGETITVYLKQLPCSPQESLQVGTANVMAHSSHSPTPVSGTPERDSSHTPFQLQANSITLPDNVLHLQEEMNNAMVHLLTIRASIDACQWRIMSWDRGHTLPEWN